MRFVKLELTWYGSPWIRVLSDGSRLAWVMLLCYAKASGLSGRVKRMDPDFAARQWLLGEEDVRRMEEAALRDGALAVDGTDWVVANWHRYQGDETGSERQRRFREAKGMGESNGRNALRNGSNGEEKRREEKRGDTTTPISPKGEPAPEKEWYDYALEKGIEPSMAEHCYQYYEARNWTIGEIGTKEEKPMTNWKLALVGWRNREAKR